MKHDAASDELARAALPLNATGHDRQSLVDALRGKPLPSYEIALATLHGPEIEQDIVAVVEQARREDLDSPSSRLFLRGIHLAGGRRLTALYRPFVAFLRDAGRQRTNYLLEDCITETLAYILAGLFDDDTEPLFGLMNDSSVDEFIRDAAFGAFAFLTFDGRIERATTEDFLQRYAENSDAEPGDMGWIGWMRAIAMLGIDRLGPLVDAAYRDGRIPEEFADENDYREMLLEALNRPADFGRFEKDNLGYIEDVLECLVANDYDFEPEEEAETPVLPATDYRSLLSGFFDRREPAVNPYRDVGRNDPCPCGSGKKYKRCCLD